MLCCSTLFVEGMTMCTGPAFFVLKDHFHPCFSFLHTSGKANFLLPLRRHILSLRHYSFVSAKITFFSFCKGCSPYSIFGHIFFDRSDFFFAFCKGRSLDSILWRFFLIWSVQACNSAWIESQWVFFRFDTPFYGSNIVGVTVKSFSDLILEWQFRLSPI